MSSSLFVVSRGQDARLEHQDSELTVLVNASVFHPTANPFAS